MKQLHGADAIAIEPRVIRDETNLVALQDGKPSRCRTSIPFNTLATLRRVDCPAVACCLSEPHLQSCRCDR